MKTCLVVDDSKAIRGAIKRIVTDLGFAASEAPDGQQALNACKQQMPDLVLLDWNMPVMNGPEFLGQLNTLPAERKPVVIFCTTESSLEHIEKALTAGASEYIMKPFDRDILESKLQQAGVL